MSAAPTPGDALETTESHAAAEGAEASSDVGSTSTLREMLMSTEPEPDLETVESPWDPDNGGRNRMYRGVQKAVGVSGLPAVVDFIWGAMEELYRLNLDEPDEQDDADQEAQDEGEGDPLETSPVGGA